MATILFIQSLTDSSISLANFPQLVATLTTEITGILEFWSERMEGLVYEGITNEYRIELAVSFLYKAMINALDQIAPNEVPDHVRSCGKITWGHWPISDGTQSYKIQDWKAPVSQPYVKILVMYQASGQGTLYA